MDGFSPDYDDNKLEDTLYLSEVHTNEGGGRYRHAELLFNAENMPLEKAQETNNRVQANVVCDALLYETAGGQQKIHCWIEEYPGKNISYTNGLRISRRTKKGVYASQEICLNLEGAIKLKKFLDKVFSTNFNDTAKRRINIDQYLSDSPDIKTVKISKEDFESILAFNVENLENYDAIFEIHRREQAICRLEEIIHNKEAYKNENEINKFLSNNLWMFDNDYVFFSDKSKINAQNILDLVPVTFDGFIDIIELKLPNVKIVNFDASHNNYYPSAELTKAIAQCMNYIVEIESLSIDKETYFKPRATIIIGSLQELTRDEKRFLRLLNANYHNIRIYTYQQLLIKAKNSLDFITKRSHEK